MIVVGTTLTYFAVADPERAFLWNAWLMHVDEMRASYDGPVKFFAAIQVDKRGMEPFRPLTDRLLEIGGDWWSWSLNDGRTEVTQANRLRHITAGQNMINLFATEERTCTHMLHMAADCEAPPDVIPKLLEVNNGLAAAECSTYNFQQPTDYTTYPFPTAGPPMTAVCLLVERNIFKRARWRYDPDLNLSDDPSLTLDAEELFGVRTIIRRDCVAIHHPQAISSIDTRFPGLDMSVQF